MTTVLEAVNGAFQALFYGDGAWFGIMLILCMCLAMMLKWKYSGVLFLPITIFLGIDYLEHDMGWHAMLIWSASLFLLLYMVKQIK